MSNRQVIYLTSGTPHLPYLVTSLYTLRIRAYWGGEIHVYAWPESHDLVKSICCHPLIAATPHKREPRYRRKDGVGGNAQFLDKIDLMSSLNTDVALYLDADTLIDNPIDNLFYYAEKYEFAATQFNDWVSNGKVVSKRINRLRGVEGIDEKLIDEATTKPYPSVNGGVFACQPNSQILPIWYKWTLAAGSTFISDESVLHLLATKFGNTEHMIVATGGAYNVSPKHSKLSSDEVVVIHGHGDSFVRPNKKGVAVWWPMYRLCKRENIGNINDWLDESYCGNKHLKRLEESAKSGMGMGVLL